MPHPIAAGGSGAYTRTKKSKGPPGGGPFTITSALRERCGYQASPPVPPECRLQELLKLAEE